MAAPMNRAWRKYLVHFAHEHIDFRIPELLSVSKLFGINLNIPSTYDVENPFLLIELPSEEFVKKVTARSVLVKSVYELWVQATSSSELTTALKALPTEEVAPYVNKDTSYKINVETFNKSLQSKEKLARIETIIDEVSFTGKVDLKTPQATFCLFEDYGPVTQSTSPPNPQAIYFGRWVSSSNRKEAVHKFSLKTRKFIGNTSMDPTLSLIMANQAAVESGSMVLDPFVGTGSLLVAAAHNGGMVAGTDIDYNLLTGRGRASRKGQKWRSRDESIRNNLRDYGLASNYLDVLIADAARSQMWRDGEMFDAIITDPPYGIREPTQKVGTRKEKVEMTEEQRGDHISSKIQWPVGELLRELLNMAARLLRTNGRLVYWLPVYKPEYSEATIPRHPCLRLVANSEQNLQARVSRRLITMQKHRPVQSDEDLHGAYFEENTFVGSSFRDKYFKPVQGKRTQGNNEKTEKDSPGKRLAETGGEEKDKGKRPALEGMEETRTEKTEGQGSGDNVERVVEDSNG